MRKRPAHERPYAGLIPTILGSVPRGQVVSDIGLRTPFPPLASPSVKTDGSMSAARRSTLATGLDARRVVTFSLIPSHGCPAAYRRGRAYGPLQQRNGRNRSTA